MRFRALRGPGAFARVMRGGRLLGSGSLRCHVLVEFHAPASLTVGIAVSSRSYGAVDRNRLRRLVREAFRQEQGPLMELLTARTANVSVVVRCQEGWEPRRVKAKDVAAPISALCKEISRLVTSGSA